MGWVLSTRLARHIGYLELLLKLMFVNPPELPEQTTKALPCEVRLVPLTEVTFNKMKQMKVDVMHLFMFLRDQKNTLIP